MVKEFPRNNLAYQAIENAKRIYLDEGNYKAFETWAKNIDFYEVNTSEIESLAYDDAMRKFDAKITKKPFHYWAILSHNIRKETTLMQHNMHWAKVIIN